LVLQFDPATNDLVDSGHGHLDDRGAELLSPGNCISLLSAMTWINLHCRLAGDRVGVNFTGLIEIKAHNLPLLSVTSCEA
jgi:hypothetical protein